MPTPTIDIDAIAAQVQDATGLSDFGESTWREGAERLGEALTSEANLTELGAAIAGGDYAAYLTSRLRLTEAHRLDPTLAVADVVPPIVILGQPRTGTTILFDLLAQDPEHRVPLTWEVDEPFPAPETATYETDERIAASQARSDASELLIPGFLSMHAMGARLGQECVRITGGDFRSMIFPTQWRVPSYHDWLHHEADLSSTYRYHRRFLQHLQSRHAKPRWLLKSPAHLWSLAELMAEYPGALVVQTHRDPVRIISSLGSLVTLLRSMSADEAPISEAAQEFADVIIDGLDRGLAARRDGTIRPDRIVDVHFADFRSDPMATVGVIYDRLGIPLSAQAESRMRTFLAANPREKHGDHRYRFADTGLDVDEIRARSKGYCDHFDVPEEEIPA